MQWGWFNCCVLCLSPLKDLTSPLILPPSDPTSSPPPAALVSPRGRQPQEGGVWAELSPRVGSSPGKCDLDLCYPWWELSMEIINKQSMKGIEKSFIWAKWHETPGGSSRSWNQRSDSAGGPAPCISAPLQVQMPSVPEDQLCKPSPLHLSPVAKRECLSQERSKEWVTVGAKIPHLLTLLWIM